MRINQLPKEQRIREGKLIEARMNALNITQDALADELNVTQGYISKWRSGTKQIPPKHFMWLAGRLKFDPFEIRPELKEYTIQTQLSSGDSSRINEKVAQYKALANEDDLSRLENVVDALLSELNRRQDKQ